MLYIIFWLQDFEIWLQKLHGKDIPPFYNFSIILKLYLVKNTVLYTEGECFVLFSTAEYFSIAEIIITISREWVEQQLQYTYHNILRS